MEFVLYNRIWLGITVVLSSLIISACSDQNENNEEVEKDTEIQQTEVDDEVLFSVIRSNLDKMLNHDLDGYMETIHSKSPAYEKTKEQLSEWINNEVEIEQLELEVQDKNEDRAVVSFLQRLTKSNETERMNIKGEHTLMLEDGEWKIYETEILSKEIVEGEIDSFKQEEVEMTGVYSEKLSSLAMPFDSDDWILVTYEESDGIATAEYILSEENLENYSKIITYDYYEDGNEWSSLSNFIDVLELSVEEMITGKVDFTRLFATESEVVYRYRVDNDPVHSNQEEIGRIFTSDDDLYVIRYTVMEDVIESTEEIMTLLQKIQ